MNEANPHLGQPLVHAGVPLSDATVAVLLVHGRGQGPAGIIESLVQPLRAPGVAYVVPRAAGDIWYNARYLAPEAELEPQRGQALEALAGALATIADAGIAVERTVIAGFSQGACLAAELVWRTPRPYGGLVVLTGALTGPPNSAHKTPTGGLEGLRVLMSTAREDTWVRLDDVERTAAAFAAAGAKVDLTVHEEPEHAIYPSDITRVRKLLAHVAGLYYGPDSISTRKR